MSSSAARYTKLIQLQQLTIDTTGEYDVETWANVSDAWVSISPDRGREVPTQGELVATVVYSIRGDYRDLQGISEKMRALLNVTQVYTEPYPADTKVYEIIAVMPDEEFEDDIMLKAVLRNRTLSNIG